MEKGIINTDFEYIENKVLNNERITTEEAIYLLENVGLLELGRLANFVRKQKHPDNIATFVVDRNINYTNVCVAGCKFCAFQRRKSDSDAYVLDFEEIYKKVEELVNWGGTTLLMQGGLNPDLRLDFYVELFKGIKERFPQIHIHSLSATEINYLSKIEKLSVEETLKATDSKGNLVAIYVKVKLKEYN